MALLLEKNGLSYKDVAILPNRLSTVKSRTDVNTLIEAFGLTYDVPIIASPMPDICDGQMAFKLAACGATGMIHRFQSIDQQLIEFISTGEFKRYSICAIGITGDYIDRAHALYDEGCRIFCMDTANGYSTRAKDAIENFKKRFPAFLIAGNVSTAGGYEYLARHGADAIRVGIAGGSVCDTNPETGIFYPMISTLMDCERAQAEWNLNKGNAPLIIADGGVSTPADFAKAIGAGADFILSGAIFAGIKDTPGAVIKDVNGNKYKMYRGAASYGVQREFSGEAPDYNEGAESIVPYREVTVDKVLSRFGAGLRSAMSYLDARDISTFRSHCVFVKI